jgi:SAM-dependent methyltransferase
MNTKRSWPNRMSLPQNNPHYSYAIYADPATARQFDDSHFGGPIGRLVMEDQERVLFDLLGKLDQVRLLDVGTGTGRAALAAAARGAQVTGLDASAEMLKVAAGRAEQAGLAVTFLQGDAHALEFPERSFPVVISLRMLMHTPDWRQCLAELCRVADARLVFDFPPLLSAAALQVGARRLAQWAGRRVEAYQVIPVRAMRAVLSAHGFRVVRTHRQFVLPIAFHKLIGSRAFTEGAEGLLSALGLLGLVGAPVTVLAERTVQ